MVVPTQIYLMMAAPTMKKLKLFRNTVLIDIDTGKKNSTIFLSGMGRSGTTWISEIINHDNSYCYPDFLKKWLHPCHL